MSRCLVSSNGFFYHGGDLCVLVCRLEMVLGSVLVSVSAVSSWEGCHLWLLMASLGASSLQISSAQPLFCFLRPFLCGNPSVSHVVISLFDTGYGFFQLIVFNLRFSKTSSVVAFLGYRR